MGNVKFSSYEQEQTMILPEDVHDVCRLLVFDTAVKRFDKPRELWDGFCSMVKVSHAHPVCTYNEDT